VRREPALQLVAALHANALRKQLGFHSLMDMDFLQLSGIAAAGGGMIVDARSSDYLQLSGIAKQIGQGTVLIVKFANHLDYLQCAGIAKANPGRVIFDFTDRDE
jgi:hypothetical protein